MTAVVLSEIARVNIQRSTMEEAQKPIYGDKKRELRRQAIMAYIRSRPAGTKIKMPEFAKIYNGTPANTFSFVNRMLRDGLIEKHNIGIRTFYYTIPGDVKLKEAGPNSGVKIGHQTFAEIVAGQAEEEHVKAIEQRLVAEKILPESISSGLNGFYGYSTEDSANDRTEQKAKQFAWAYPELHNDLREFIKWLKSQA